MTAAITVERLLGAEAPAPPLENLTPGVPLDGPVTRAGLSNPGLALAGYTARIARGQLQLFGETEMSYLSTLPADQVRWRLEAVFACGVPAVIVSSGLEVPSPFLDAAEGSGVAVFRSGLATAELHRALGPRLDDLLAPTTSIHGSLADVYGIGLLFTGPSGIGKSECVLGLVRRGHRLVADDLVLVSRRGSDIIVGRAHELQNFHMEIRGIGIIDVASMFGTRATRLRKRIEVVVDLQPWDDARDYDRTGLDREMTDILGVEVPRLAIPLNPGKNPTAISEVIAMNQLLAYRGVDMPTRFNEALRRAMNPLDRPVDDHE